MTSQPGRIPYQPSGDIALAFRRRAPELRGRRDADRSPERYQAGARLDGRASSTGARIPIPLPKVNFRSHYGNALSSARYPSVFSLVEARLNNE